MSDQSAPRDAEARRLERLWSGEFGDAYTERNAATGAVRETFWRDLLGRFPVTSALEVGCNVGANLRWIAANTGKAYGIDINEGSLRRFAREDTSARVILGNARTLPLRSAAFEIVLTVGVLIHQPESTVRDVMREMLRCSRRFVLCAEYYADETVEVPYRGQQGALFKRDYGAIFKELAPDLVQREREFLSRADGWDDVTYWLFERAA